MNWYEKITDREIENLKGNRTRLDMLDAESSGTGQNMRRIPHGLVEYWAVGGAGWEKSPNNGESLSHVMTYRLKPDWERPELEHWYKDITYIEIEAMKSNLISQIVLRSVNYHLAHLLDLLPLRERQYFNPSVMEWNTCEHEFPFSTIFTYRLRPDWSQIRTFFRIDDCDKWKERRVDDGLEPDCDWVPDWSQIKTFFRIDESERPDIKECEGPF